MLPSRFFHKPPSLCTLLRHLDTQSSLEPALKFLNKLLGFESLFHETKYDLGEAKSKNIKKIILRVLARVPRRRYLKIMHYINYLNAYNGGYHSHHFPQKLHVILSSIMIRYLRKWNLVAQT